MKNVPQHTIKLQDGTLCNFRKRLWKRAKPLIYFLKKITDPRKKRGIRHSLLITVFILFAGITRKETTLKGCYLWAIHNKAFLKKYFPSVHAIPDPTTMSRLLQKMNPQEFVEAYLCFIRILGISLGDILSADGKTMRAVTGKDTIRHILTVLSHVTHAVIAQIGVSQKENEIPALKRLIEENPQTILNKLLLADALHTNPETAKKITDAQGDYLLVVKGNQKELFADIIFSLNEQNLNIVSGGKALDISQSYTSYQTKRKRSITTTVKTSTDPAIIEYIQSTHGWKKVKTIGMLERTGTRVSKDGTVSTIDETIGIISSRELSAPEMAKLLRNHWCIENNLHWIKDFVFLEDRQTLRKGNAPQIMSFLRSMCISLMNLLGFESISDALNNFNNNKMLHYQFLRVAAIV